MTQTVIGGSVSDGGLPEAVALVTGAAGGIGAAVAAALTSRRALVARCDRAEPAAGAGPFYRMDVADAASVDETIRRIEADLGPIELLVNVAGVLRTGPVIETSTDDWSAVFDVNAHGVFYVSRAVARAMVPRGRGSIVTVSSNAAGVPRSGMAAYAASKAAATHFTKCLGLELAPQGIRCNVVAPGSTDTPMQRGLWTGDDGAARAVAGDPAAFKAGIPLGRIATPADIADAVLFLCSDAARHVTLQELYVDGGASLT